MKSTRLIQHKMTDLKPLFMIICCILLGIMLWIVPPAHPFLILFFIFLVTALVTTFISTFKKTKLTIIVSLFTLSFLVITFFVGPDLMNTILLLSFIIALSQLIPTQPQQA